MKNTQIQIPNSEQAVPTGRTRLLKAAFALLLAFTAIGVGQAQTILVPFNQNWKYMPNNVDLGAAWRAAAYDDSGWSNGVGPLGFSAAESLSTGVLIGSGLSIQTVIPQFSPTDASRVRTYYFRVKFNYPNNPAGVTLLSSNLIDDAAVFYLNGVEIGRPGFNAATVVTHASEGNRAADDVTVYGWDVFTNAAPTPLIQGENILAVEVHQTGASSSDLVFANKMIALVPTPVTITLQPTNQTVPENRVISLVANASGFPAPTFQWYKGTNAPALVPDATNATYTITNTVVADTGDYFVVAQNTLNSATSRVARLSVVSDTNGPVVLSIKADETFQRITINWDEVIGQGPAIESGSYFILDPAGNQVDVTSVDYGGSNVVLHVATMQKNTNYTIEIDYQQDLVGNLTKPVGNPQQDPGNGIATNFHTFAISPGFTRFDAYLGLPSGQTIAQFVAMPIYPNSPTFSFATNVLYWPQSVPNIEQYAMRFSGLYIATESGTHKFNPDHDDEFRLRIYGSDDPSGAFSELGANTVDGLLDGPTLDVDLVAGNTYYYELIVREFGGGDHAGIAVTLPSTAVVSPINSAYMALAVDPALAPNGNISQQPQSQSVAENHSLTFSVTVTNGGNSVAYQWQRQPNGGGGFVNIPGALGSTYTTPLLTLANSGDQYRVIVNLPGRSVTSAPATSSVVVDNAKPIALAARGTRGLNAVLITFNEAMASASAINPANYTLTATNGTPLTITGAPTLSADLLTVTIPTSGQTPGQYYVAHIQNVTDVAGNVITTTNLTFQTWVLSPGFALFEAYNTGGGNLASDLLASPLYPNSPDLVTYLSTFDSRNVYPTDSREGYGARMSGYFIAPVTTNYIFYLRSDDGSQFSMNTNAANSTDPAGLTKLQEELSCCNAFSVHPTTNPPPRLTGGQAYYMELLYKEGTGGDFGQLAFKTAGDPRNPDTLTPIPGAYLATLADPVGASVTITQQPGNKTFVIASGATPLATQTFNANDGGYTVSTPVAFTGPWTYNAARGSWQESGQDADNGHPNTSLLNSTPYTVTAFGNVLLNLTHRWSFEHDGTAWDGGQIRVSVNGGAFTTLPLAAFIQNGYNGTVGPGSTSDLNGQPGFIAESSGYAASYVVSTANLGLFNPGDTLRIQFFAGSDSNTRGQVPNWEIDQVALTQGNGEPNVTFSVASSGMTSVSTNPPRAYQWYRNIAGVWTPIVGANSASYSFVPVQADNGAQFRVVVYVPGASATSTTSTLTVTTGGSNPTLRSTYSNGTLTLSWDAPARLQFTTSLNAPINWRDLDLGGATSYAVVLSNQFSVNLDSAQENNPADTSTAIGSGTITLSNNVLVVDVVYSGLSADRSADHFHAPGARGASAGVAYDLGTITTGVRAGTVKGLVPLVDNKYGSKNIAAQIQDIRNSLWYLNIHSVGALSGGEIRGQVEPGARFYRLVTP